MSHPGEPADAAARFNVSRWALEHPALTRYLMLVLMVLGVAAYFQLGQDEDPPFTFRAMVVQAFWPGATAQQMAEQVTDKIEKTLQEVPYADKIRSYSKPGESQVIFELKDSSKPAEVANTWYQVRKKIGDMRQTLPQGVLGTAALFVAALVLAAFLPLTFRAALAAYLGITLAYTFYLKQLVLVDILILAGLYTVRLVAGAEAIEVPLSFWLLALSFFLFMSLALVKRYTELLVQRDSGSLTVHGRGYQVRDFPLLQTMGMVSGQISVLVLALYINSESGRVLYRHIEYLWFLCVLLLFWVNRVWLLAHRGEMHDDPLVFALKDRVSRAIAVVASLAVWLAR